MAARWSGLRRVCALAALSLGAGCGVWIGEPIELFPENSSIDGGVDSSDPCLETAQPLTANGKTVIGATVSQLVALVDGDHGNALLWVGGDATRITLSIHDPKVTSIVSRTNPAAEEPFGARHCANHARIDATLRISTVDGRLDESVGSIRMIAYSEDEARGSFVLHQLKGSYKPTLRREHCFISATVRFLIAVDGTHGSLTDQLGASDCGPDGGTVGSADYAGGHWGARWQNY
ncbi:MAG: hypothetical protein RLZZ450_4057 [Pseudomonadota bacterium]